MDDSRRTLTTLLVVGLFITASVLGLEALAPQLFGIDPNAKTKQSQTEAGVGSDGQAESGNKDSESASHGRPAGLTEQQRAARLAGAKEGTIRGEGFEATFSNLNTGMTHFRLDEERFVTDGEHMDLVTTDREEFFPLQIELGGMPIPSGATWEMEQLSEQSLRFRYVGDGFTVVRELRAGSGKHQIWSTVHVRNKGRSTRPVRLKLKTFHYVSRDEEGGGFFAAPAAGAGKGVCKLDEEDIGRYDRKALEQPHGFGPNVRFAGIETQYFATLMAAEGAAAERCQLFVSDRGGTVEEPAGSLFESRLVYPRAELAAGDEVVYKTLAFAGPKDVKALEEAGHTFKSAVDLGWFATLGELLTLLLAWIYGFIGNWGWSIILLTFIVKLVLFPLTHKSFESMARMRVLKPEMDRINELYADDREKKGAAIMDLYRKHKINPLGGCLPSLLQMPVWFALYQSLSTNLELYRTPFGVWLSDLSAPDPLFILPVILGGLFFLQQKLTPTSMTMDPTQAKIMLYGMPLMMSVFMIFLPAGLGVYMITNSALGIAQQKYIHWRLDQKTDLASDDDDSSDDEDDADVTPDSTKRPGASARAKKRKKRQRRARA